jgi:hypothetical protein
MQRMTVFSTPFWKRSELAALLLALLLAAVAAFASQPHGIEVRKASFVAEDEHYVLEADIDVILSAPLEDALNKGIPLYFTLEFEGAAVPSFLQCTDSPVSHWHRRLLPEFSDAEGSVGGHE